MTAAQRLDLPDDPSQLDRFALANAPAGSYQWWYFDALSDDGRYGLVAIYFVGGVFSSHYADRWAAGESPSPLDHPMVNLALYDRQKQIGWVFSEYPREALQIADPCLDLRIGANSLVRKGPGEYELRVRDRDFPRRREVEATIRFHSEHPPLAPEGLRLSRDGRHRWGSPAPRCRVEVNIPSHGLAWSGSGYHDMNTGAEPLHQGFRSWSWGRAHLGDETRIFYDAIERDGTRVHHVLCGRDGRLEYGTPTPGILAKSQLTPWLVRLPDVDAGLRAGSPVKVTREQDWESSPFYARWVARFQHGPEASRGVCEFVDLGRFAQPLVRFMIRYRTYRRRWPGGEPYPTHARWAEVASP